MISTPTLAAAWSYGTAVPAPAAALPAAVAAPLALVKAVGMPFAQETTALLRGSRTRNHVPAPPPRGTPV